MNYEDAKAAARICLRYAAAIETKLYMGMGSQEAHDKIAEAQRLAEVLDTFADTLDTISPVDLG